MKTEMTQSEQVDLCLDHKNWTGISVRELATAGRFVVRELQDRHNIYELADEVVGPVQDTWDPASIKDDLQKRRDLVDAIARKTVELYESNYATK